MNCLYCGIPCERDGRWHECHYCRVNYLYDDGGNNLHIKWERELKNWKIALNLYPQENYTILVAFSDEYLDSDDLDSTHGMTRIELNHCMKNVNQWNCIDKIKLLLTFQ